MARDDKGKKRRDRRALRREAKKPVQQQNVPQEGSTLSNVVGDVSVTDNTQTPPPSSPSVSASSFDFSGMSDEQETAAIENRTKELVAKLKPIYVNRMGGSSAESDGLEGGGV